MKWAGIVIGYALVSSGCRGGGGAKPAEPSPQAAAKVAQPVRLVTGLGSTHHAVSTKSAEAQKFFDQGLAYYYAFNHAEAIRSFKRAAELDPACAMAYWGEALALGPNINMDVDPDAEKAAFAAEQKALAASRGPTISEHERGYVNALLKRYTDDPKGDLKKLARDYKTAMGEVSRAYPDDLDAATLYAESAMDLRPWKLWTKDGKPEDGTEEIVSTLEGVLKRDPNHLGANHFYIHAVEASTAPGRAIDSAHRLPGLAPAAGHLVHMPAHVYIRTGDYAAAIKANRDAAATDERYIACCKPAGIYPVMYYNHNRHFLAVAACMTNDSKTALAAADALGDAAREGVKQLPIIEPFAAVPMLVRVRFARWDDFASMPAPDASTLPTTSATWHLGHGLALVAKGNGAQAGADLTAIRDGRKNLEKVEFGLNSASDVLAVGEHLLAGRILASSGDSGRAIAEYRKAVEAQDALSYDEPPAFPWPVRESLGAALLKSGDAAGAETVFREDLKKNPNNPRSLLGLAQSLKARNSPDAPAAEAAASNALSTADVPVKVEQF
jgi:tetratricopeptide (TPR) repeat protein